MNEQLIASLAMGITAGMPAGFIALRHLSGIATTMLRAVTALERIADRLDSAEYVKLGAK